MFLRLKRFLKSKIFKYSFKDPCCNLLKLKYKPLQSKRQVWFHWKNLKLTTSVSKKMSYSENSKGLMVIAGLQNSSCTAT